MHQWRLLQYDMLAENPERGSVKPLVLSSVEDIILYFFL